MEHLLTAMETRIREDIKDVARKQETFGNRLAEHGVRIGNLESHQGQSRSFMQRAVTFLHVTIVLGTVSAVVAFLKFAGWTR